MLVKRKKPRTAEAMRGWLGNLMMETPETLIEWLKMRTKALKAGKTVTDKLMKH